MNDLLKKVPAWLIILVAGLVLLVCVTCVFIAVNDGRKIELGPLVIHAKEPLNIAASTQEAQNSKQALIMASATAAKALSIQESIALFPQAVQADSIKGTQKQLLNLISEYETQNKVLTDSITLLRKKLSEVQEIEGTFLYKLLIFNRDAQCYGSTLNFTAGSVRNECLPKTNLAARFTAFLSEIDFYVGKGNGTPKEAKRQLLRLQEKYQFNTKGWYGPDVFNAIISEFYNKEEQPHYAGQ